VPCYEHDCETGRAKLGLNGPNFDHFFRNVENHIGNFPWDWPSEEVPDSEGIRAVPTEYAAPDIPPMYVYYRVEHQPNKIVFLGLSPAWSETDTV